MLEDDDMSVDDVSPDEGEGAPRESYNFAPGYHGIVYRADVPDRGAGSSRQRGTKVNKGTPADETAETAEEETSPSASQMESDHPRYKLQSMKWGLIPFWTKRNPDYASMLKTINCRDDSLATPGGMWASMKARKRCIVIAQGFYEWLRPGGPGSKEKIPHYVKRKDSKLMCFAGLWDCVQYEDDDSGYKNYTYTVITTDSNKQLKFLHDRMPVILDPGSKALSTWLDPGRYEWTAELQSLLKPYSGELEVYPVTQEVGKVGNNSPNFVIPVASKENKNNIANFFAKGAKKNAEKKAGLDTTADEKTITAAKDQTSIEPVDDVGSDPNDSRKADQTPGLKREAPSSPTRDEPPLKKVATSSPFKSPTKEKQQGRGKISATSNASKSPSKKKMAEPGSQKITSFFTK